MLVPVRAGVFCRPEDAWAEPSPDVGTSPGWHSPASDLGRLPVLGALGGEASQVCPGHVSPAHDCSLVSAENLRIH